MNNIDVSIIIVNWNTKHLLCNCVSSIYENNDDLKSEIIVVDNASSDGSAEVIRLKFKEIKLIANMENRGFAAANNQGIAASKGRYILLLNSDTLIFDDSIRRLIAFADLHREAGVVGCKILNHDKTSQSTCFMFPSIVNMFFSACYLNKLFRKNHLFGRERMTWWDRDDQRQVDVVSGCFMLVRRQAIEQVGMMDERFFMYAEETDWCYRFKRSGWAVIFTPIGQIIHLGGQSTQKVKSNMLIQLRLSILKFMDKHHGWFKHKIACCLTILFFAIRIPVWFIIGLLNHKNKQTARLFLHAYIAGIGQVLINSAYSSKKKIVV